MKPLLAALLLSALALAGCSGGVDGGSTGVVHEIAMHNMVYEPSAITAAKGDTLRFFAHDTTHAARTMDGTYDAGDIPTSMTEGKDLVLDKAGTFVFKCRFHSGMQLTATVTA